MSLIDTLTTSLTKMGVFEPSQADLQLVQQKSVSAGIFGFFSSSSLPMLASGSRDVQSYHSVSMSVAVLDGLVGEFALPYIQNPVLVREHITAMRKQIDSKDRSAVLEASSEETKEKIINLLSVAEAARERQRGNSTVNG